MTKTSKTVQLQDVRDSARGMLASGQTDEALDYLLSALDSLLQKNRELELLLAKLRRERAGKRSERIDPAQLSLLFEELSRQAGADAEVQVDPKVESVADAEIAGLIEQVRKDEQAGAESTRRKKKRSAVKARDAELIDHHETIPDEERLCQSCGKPKRRIGEDVSKVLEYIPGHFVEHRYHLSKYACGKCKDSVTKAPGPTKVLERSIAGASLLARIVVSKYADHCPLHRQRRIYRREGTLMPVSTMSDWVAGVAELVQPIVDRLSERVLSAYVVGTDATGLKVLDPSRAENVQKGTMWCYVGDGRDVVFRYAPTGEGSTGPWDFLAGRSGYIQADAANVFDRLFNGQVASAVEVGCWSHGRRRMEAMKDTDCRVAYPLRLIARLYRIETLGDVRRLEPDDRTELRKERSSVVLDKLKRWLVATLANEPPASSMAQAAGYLWNHWEALGRFVQDGRLSLDNNCVERQIRDIALGRRNFLFAGSHDAARRAAALYSLMRTCAQHQVPPLDYLWDVLELISRGWPVARVDELLPDVWLRTNAHKLR
jgi:transposase